MPLSVSAGERADDQLPGPGRWYAVQTHPRKELYAEMHLRRQGFRVFVPRIEHLIRHARQTKISSRPMFSQYGFVSFDLTADRWRSVLGTRGVRTLVMMGQEPQPLPRGLVEGLQAAFDKGGAASSAPEFSVGDRVRFLSGPFAEKIGMLTEMSDLERVGVLIEILGAERKVQASARELLPCA